MLGWLETGTFLKNNMVGAACVDMTLWVMAGVTVLVGFVDKYLNNPVVFAIVEFGCHRCV